MGIILRQNRPAGPAPPWAWVWPIAALGLLLRLLAAQGALWLDEAWSAVTAHDVATPLGILLQINHDNNHHLTSLWLQLVGLDASPVLQRGLSILTGTLTIPVAALIAVRAGKWPAIVAALFFAISPLLVIYGAEARGYAPMLLAMLVTVLLVARWLDHPTGRVPAIPIALAVLLGMLSQLTMAFGLAAIALWVMQTLWPGRDWRGRIRVTARIFAPLLIPAILVILLVLGAANAAGTGIRVGNYEPFSLAALARGWTQMLGALLGGFIALFAMLLLCDPRLIRAQRDQRLFALLLVVPLGVLLLQLPNSGAPRYHLLSGVGLLMLVSIAAGYCLASRAQRHRIAARTVIAIAVAFALFADWQIIENRRADPGVALDALAARAPTGAGVAVDRQRSSAILRAASASRHYPMRIVETPCAAAPFLFIDRDGADPFPDPATRCGARYRVIAEGHPTGLSGTHWKLYERVAGGQH